MNAIQPIKTGNLQSSPLQNAQSLLRSTETKSSEKGRYGRVLNEETGLMEFDFIPETGFSVTVGKRLPAADIAALEQANKPASFQFIVMQLSRLALHKHTRAGETTSAAFFADLASDIGDVGELTMVEACARLRRTESPFYPSSAEIIATVGRVKSEIEANLAWQPPAENQNKPAKPQVDDWQPPSEADKANVHDIVQQCIRNLSA